MVSLSTQMYVQEKPCVRTYISLTKYSRFLYFGGIIGNLG